MNDDIKKIIKAGTMAPSGENCQPWKFIVEGLKISVYNIPEADQSLYNFHQRGSYVAHGALVENIYIAAAKFGYKTNVKIFPKKDEPNLVSVITLEKSQPNDEQLYSSIENRCTNRKDFTGQKLTNQQKNELVNAVKEGGFGELRLVDDDENLKILGSALAVNEQIVFENKDVHTFFYNHILWKEDEQSKAGGFYVKTLEFLPHQLKGVKLFKSWTILSLLNKLAGASKMIVKENAEKYAKSGTIGIIVADKMSDNDFVSVGRSVERAWLTAAKLGLAFHPCTGTIYFADRINSGDTKSFSSKHSEIIKEAYGNIESVFKTQGKSIPFLFRIGYAPEPTARAMRMGAEIKFR